MRNGARDRRLSRNRIAAGAGLVVVLVAATTASSIAPAADAPVRVQARLSQGAGLLLEIDGTRDPRKTDQFKITGDFRGIPCPGKTSRLAIVQSVGTSGLNYDATLVLRPAGGDRIRCGGRLPRTFGRTLLRLQIYSRSATPADSLIAVKGRRTGATAIEGVFTTHDLLCGNNAYRLQVQLSSPSGPVSSVYDLTMKNVSLLGRKCV
jgi:hypothetical protein